MENRLRSSIYPSQRPSFLFAALAVTVCHAILFFMLARQRTPHHPVKAQRLVVKTINLAEEPASPSKAARAAPKEASAAVVPEAKPQPQPAREKSAPAAPKTEPLQEKTAAEASKSKPAIQKQSVEKQKDVEKRPRERRQVKPAAVKPPGTSQRKEKTEPSAPKREAKQQEAAKEAQRAYLKKAQESIGKFQSQGAKINSAKEVQLGVPVPASLEGLPIDDLPGDGAALLNAEETGYRAELASRLKILLKLPEYGEVKVKLTLERTGKVLKVAIVSAESGANRKYIEKTLPEIQFPSFGTSFGKQQEYTFSLTLSNGI